MKKQITVSGFGGQGVLSIGKSLVEAGMDEGLEVTWAPSYGPEMRGGTANCSVVISDKPIGSPVFTHPTELIAMIIVNSSVVEKKVERTDVKSFYVPCVDIATELGNTKVANMVMLGAYVKATGALKVETVQEMIKNMFTGRKAKLVPMNMEALQRGMECIK